MIALGIIDPVKVTRTALENAASIATMILTTESPDHGHPGAAGRRAAAPADGLLKRAVYGQLSR